MTTEHKPHSVQDDLFLIRAALGHPPLPVYIAAIDRLEEQLGDLEEVRAALYKCKEEREILSRHLSAFTGNA